MQTDLPTDYLATPRGHRADEILRSCVHCGFCNATCPTFQVLNDELDGPRGRIYLIKDMLESATVNSVARTHLDRCLTCRACETACPSGVRYGELLEIGRDFIEKAKGRSLVSRLVRAWLTRVVASPLKLRRWLRIGWVFRAIAPRRLRLMMARPAAREKTADSGNVILLQGCVQRVMTPEVNRHLISLLTKRGVKVRSDEGESCCGGLALHVGRDEEAYRVMRENLDVLESPGVDRIVSTASGCGVTLKEYGRLLADDVVYRQSSESFAAKVCDVAELLRDFEFDKLDGIDRVAWHSPCTLQHGQKITGLVEKILIKAGYDLVLVPDAHMCCGSAGAYSILEPKISEELKRRKIAALTGASPDVIATANVGCQMHLRPATSVPVRHWLQLLR